MDNKNSNIDFNEMLKLIKSITKPAPNTPPPVSSMDKLVNSQEVRVMKAILPYINPESKKNLAFIIKLMEFKKTMDLFSSNNDTVLLELNKEPVSKLDLIKDIRDSVDGKNKNTLNMLYNVMNIKNVLESLNSSQNLLEKEDSRPNISSEFNEKDINTTEGNDNNNFDGFINMLNKIIDEKEMGE
jgi:hypothetical protein